MSPGWCGGENFIEAVISYRRLGNDANGNGVPDDCDGATCQGDVDQNGALDFADVMEVIGNWGPCGECPQDVDEDARVHDARAATTAIQRVRA